MPKAQPHTPLSSSSVRPPGQSITISPQDGGCRFPPVLRLGLLKLRELGVSESRVHFNFFNFDLLRPLDAFYGCLICKGNLKSLHGTIIAVIGLDGPRRSIHPPPAVHLYFKRR